MLSSGLSSFHALARNPWDLSQEPRRQQRRRCGRGCAAGYGPLHIGTDIGGSIRLPAGWCGVFGLKPSLGRIPIEPPYAGRVAGPMTRTVDDAALVMTRADPARCARHDEPAVAGHRLATSSNSTSVACDSACGWMPAGACRSTPRCAPRSRRRRDAFEAAGAIVEPVAPFTTRGPWPMAWTPSGACAPGWTSRRCRSSARPVCCPTSATGRRRRGAQRRAGVPRLQPDGRDARRRCRGLPSALTSCSRRSARWSAFPAELASPTQRPRSARSSTSPSRCRST